MYCLVQAALDAANIYPSNNPIPTQDVIDAITAGFNGVAPILHCTRGGNKSYLFEVCMVLHSMPVASPTSCEGMLLACQVGILQCMQHLHLQTVAGVQVFLPVDQDFNVVDSSSVCLVHPCIPSATVSKKNFCGDKLIYKVPQPITPISPPPCVDNECDPQSGTCNK